MGLSLEFYAGDPDVIGPAFSEYELYQLRDGTLAHSYADLSLHLSITDLDILSSQISLLLGKPPIGFLDSLEQSIGGTPEESEALVVSTAWVSYVSSIPPDLGPQLTKNWYEALTREWGEETVPDTTDAEIAISSLIKLCRAAQTRQTSVVFAWYL